MPVLIGSSAEKKQDRDCADRGQAADHDHDSNASADDPTPGRAAWSVVIAIMAARAVVVSIVVAAIAAPVGRLGVVVASRPRRRAARLVLNGGAKVGVGKVGVLICYESIFPQLSRRYRRAGADLIVNMTNDAWFGRAMAPYQHEAHLRLRAIENRVGIVRAANTGISEYVDPLGRSHGATRLFVSAAPVPRPSTTYFVKRPPVPPVQRREILHILLLEPKSLQKLHDIRQAASDGESTLERVFAKKQMERGLLL